MNKCQKQKCKVRAIAQLPQEFTKICTKHETFVALTDHILFLQTVDRTKFELLQPIDFLREVYLESSRFKFFQKQFNTESLGKKLCYILYIVNDGFSYRQILENKRLKLLIDTSKAMESEIVYDEIIILTDCTLCQNFCSIFYKLPDLKQLSLVWGICTECIVEM